MGLAKPCKSVGVMVTGPGIAPQDAAGRGFGLCWNRPKPCLRSEPGQLAGDPDPLQTLMDANQAFKEQHNRCMKTARAGEARL